MTKLSTITDEKNVLFAGDVFWIIFLLVFFVGSCDSPTTVVTQKNELFVVIDEPAGENCEFGGERIARGLDLDDDRVLDSDEVQNVEFVCAEKEVSTDTLMRISDEPAGKNCEFGGKRIERGLDLDGDLVLDDDEVQNTEFVCAEKEASTDTLTRISDEPAGENCEFGGKRIERGLDLNGDLILDDDEVQNTEFVCAEKETPTNIQTRTTDEPEGENCPFGGKRIDYGIDSNYNGILDDPEITKTEFICNEYDSTQVEISHVIMVNVNNPSPGDGSCWAKAFADLQSALEAARQNDQIQEIWVARGEYLPSVLSSRAASFVLVGHVALYGGFIGIETALGERNYRTNVTVLSGDIGQKGYRGDNVYHVVKGSDQAVIDGFTISGGYADGLGVGEKYGGGMFVQDTSPTIRNCVFSGNHAAHYGGAMYVYNAMPIIESSSFVSNDAQENSNSAGGAIYSRNSSLPTIANSVFYDNNTSGIGGAIHNRDGSNATILNCSFSRNTAMNGGAIYNLNSAPRIINSILWNDAAGASTSEIVDVNSNPYVAYSLVQGGYLGGEMIADEDPLLDELGDLHLSAYSPIFVISGGDPAEAPLFDKAGAPRPLQNGYCAIGAYEPSCADSLDGLLSFVPELLRQPERSAYYSDEQFQNIKAKMIVLADLAPWQLPDQILWNENPYNNTTWLMYYHSLVWLHVYAWGYDTTGDEGYLLQMKNVLFGWIAKNPRSLPASAMSWNDHAISLRAETILYLFYKYLQPILTDSEKVILVRAFQEHAIELRSLLRDPAYKGHNHSMFHALALFGLSVALKDNFCDTSSWKEESLNRIRGLVGEMVDPVDGVSREQAAAYHYLALDLFLGAYEMLSNFDETLVLEEDLIVRMLDYAVFLRQPDGSLPAYGDTGFGWKDENQVVERWFAAGYGSSQARYVMSGGTEGTMPQDAYFYPSAGLALFRSSGGDVASSGSHDSRIFVDMGAAKKFHGHNDAMNLTFFSDGVPIIVDSGGPYIYRDPMVVDYFQHARAHNTIVVDEEDYREGDAYLQRYGDTEELGYMEGVHHNYENISHLRMVMYAKQAEALIVFDRIADTLLADREYALLYHFAPEMLISGISSSTNLLSFVTADSSTKGARVSIFSTLPYNYDLYSGYDQNGVPRGFVTDFNANKIAAPVLSITTTGAQGYFITLVVPGIEGGNNAQILSFEEQADFFTVVFSDASSETYELTIPKTEGVPTIQRIDG